MRLQPNGSSFMKACHSLFSPSLVSPSELAVIVIYNDENIKSKLI